MKRLYFILIIIIMSQAAFCEEQTKDYFIMPFGNYTYYQFDKEQIHTLGEGVIFTKGNLTPRISEKRDSLFIAGVFNQYFVEKAEDGYNGLYHDIAIVADRKIKRHLIFGVLSSQAAEPFYGGLYTFTGGIGYGYELLRSEDVSLILGGGFLAADFGIELSDGTAWPVLPLPIVRFSAKSSLVSISAEFQKSITANFTFLPESQVRLTGYFATDPIDARSARDLYIDGALWYRFFSKESKIGDFMGIGLGFKNSGFRFALSEKKKSYKVNYYSVYGTFDMSFLKLSAGYSFDGRTIYDSNIIKGIGEGFFINAFLGWRF